MDALEPAIFDHSGEVDAPIEDSAILPKRGLAPTASAGKHVDEKARVAQRVPASVPAGISTEAARIGRPEIDGGPL